MFFLYCYLSSKENAALVLNNMLERLHHTCYADSLLRMRHVEDTYKPKICGVLCIYAENYDVPLKKYI